jgi:hypothetical protein
MLTFVNKTNRMIVQKIKTTDQDILIVAQKYYGIISVINNLKLTEREIQLVAFTAVKGNITYGNVREEFCTKYNTTTSTINNIISKLKKIGLFIKEQGMVRINPVIVLDFKKNITLEIKLENEQAK